MVQAIEPATFTNPPTLMNMYSRIIIRLTSVKAKAIIRTFFILGLLF